MIDIRYEDWHAIHDHMSRTLRVDGKCIVRGGGFAVGLEERRQGVNPQMFLLTLRIVATGESPSEQLVHYDRPWDDDGIQYTEVGFVVEGPSAEAPPTLEVKDIY